MLSGGRMNMLEFHHQVGLFILSWLFWFVVLFIFTYFFQKKTEKLMKTQERVVLVGQVSFLCAIANLVVTAIV
jgi:hypothetical protein